MRTRILIFGTILAIGGTVTAVQVARAKKPPPATPGPTVATSAHTNLTPTSVTLNGTVNPKGSATTFEFQFGTTSSYGFSSGPVSAGSGTSNVPVTANLTGLTPDTTYHYRLVGRNSAGTSTTADRTFRTSPQPRAISLLAKPNPVRYGAATTLAGQLTGPNAANQQVTLEQNAFPFSGAFKAVGNPVTSDAQGNFSFPVITLLQNTQFR